MTWKVQKCVMNFCVKLKHLIMSNESHRPIYTRMCVFFDTMSLFLNYNKVNRSGRKGKLPYRSYIWSKSRFCHNDIMNIATSLHLYNLFSGLLVPQSKGIWITTSLSNTRNKQELAMPNVHIWKHMQHYAKVSGTLTVFNINFLIAILWLLN